MFLLCSKHPRLLSPEDRAENIGWSGNSGQKHNRRPAVPCQNLFHHPYMASNLPEESQREPLPPSYSGEMLPYPPSVSSGCGLPYTGKEIGRASCRERV